MFIGHYAAAMAAKRLAPGPSLGTLFAAAVLLDLIWPVLVLAGIERVHIDPGNTAFTPLDFESYPWSHSLAFALLWGTIFAGGYLLARGDRRGALVLGLLVVSHWVLDALVHRPDLPLTPYGEGRVGLGLWNSVPATLVLELALFAAGAWLYATHGRARDRTGRLAWVALIGVALAIYAANVLGAPPPDATTVAWAGLAQWLFVAWAAWVDRHRAASGVAAG